MHHLFWVRTAFLFLARSGRSSLVLSLMVVSAVASLVFLSALAVGINDAMIKNSVGIYGGHITAENPAGEFNGEKLRIKGVEGVLLRKNVTGILTRGNAFQTLNLVTIEMGEEKKHAAIFRGKISGIFPEKGEAGIFISSRFSEALNAGEGDRVLFRRTPDATPLPLTVTGIFRTGIDQLDRALAFAPAGTLPHAPGRRSAAIFLENGVSTGEVIDTYRGLFPPEVRFSPWEERMPDLRELIDLNYVSMTFVTVLVFGVVSLGISCAFVIFILKNFREYGIMKAMGVTFRELFLLIMAEVILINLAASLAGCLVGGLASEAAAHTGIDLSAFTSHNRYFAVSGVIHPRLTPYALGLPPLVAMVFSLCAGLWPAFIVAKRGAADILRSR